MYIGDILENHKFRPKDYSTQKYDCVRIYNTHRGELAFLMRSKNLYPQCWMVNYGWSNLVFMSYQEAVNFCRDHHFTLKAKDE